MGFEIFVLEFVIVMVFGEIVLKVVVVFEVGIGLVFGFDFEFEIIEFVSFVGL